MSDPDWTDEDERAAGAIAYRVMAERATALQEAPGEVIVAAIRSALTAERARVAGERGRPAAVYIVETMAPDQESLYIEGVYYSRTLAKDAELAWRRNWGEDDYLTYSQVTEHRVEDADATPPACPGDKDGGR